MIQDDFDNDLKEVTEDIGASIIYKSNAYSVVVSGLSNAYQEGETQGYFPDINLEVVIRQSLLTTAPLIRETLTYNGKVYRIVRVEADREPQAYTLTVKEATA